MTEAIATALYVRAKDLDEWAGSDYDGSSVLAAAKAGKEMGLWPEFRWSFSEMDLRLAVGHEYPAIIGVNWYEGMAEPDATGLIRKEGALVGGHAILVNGFNVRTNRYRLHNSWGRAWGINGECFLNAKDMAALLNERGEACIPVVRKEGST